MVISKFSQIISKKLTVWKGATHIEQAFSKYWMNKTIMPQSDIWIGEYLEQIKNFALN